jgi:hypothetical protein
MEARAACGPLSLHDATDSRMSGYSAARGRSAADSATLPRLSEDRDPAEDDDDDPYGDVRNGQSHFFNSLFPSRANRFGFPVCWRAHAQRL